jgi:transcriptional regulator with XRE-family HTH domain
VTGRTSSGSVSGWRLQQYRKRAGLTQAQLAEAGHLGVQMQSFLERGERKIRNTKVMVLADELQALGAGPGDVYAILMDVAAEPIIQALVMGINDNGEDAESSLAAPLRREVGQRLVLAMRHRAILKPAEKASLVDRLQSLATTSPRGDDRETGTVRNQACYYLARSGRRVAKEFLSERYHQEHHPVCQRSIAIGQAFLGDREFLRRHYVEMIRSDDLLDRSNLGYMAYWAGERRVSPHNAYNDSGAWSGEQTLSSLVKDLAAEPELLELNLHSIDLLLAMKGATLLEQDEWSCAQMARAIYHGRLPVAKNSGLREEVLRIRRHVDRAIA